MARIKRTPKAKQDLLEHVLYLAQDNPEVAERFIEATELAFEKLAQTPRMGAVQEFRSPKLNGIRRWAVPGFRNHLIFYRPTKTGVEIVRVIHGAQDVERVMLREDQEDEQ